MTQPPHYPTQPPYNRQTSPAGPGYPQPSGPTYPQNQPYPQQPPPKSGTKTSIIITTMGILLIALVITVVYLATTKNNPTANTTPSATPTPSAAPTPTQTTPTPTPGRGWTINGNQLTGPNMTAQLPPGWQTTELNGANNEGDLEDPRNHNLLTYWASFPGEGNPESVCRTRIERNRVTQNDPVESIPGQIWGGKPVLTYHLTVTRNNRGGNYRFHCLDNGTGGVAVLQAAGWAQYKEELLKDTQTVMSTWQWK